jgi:hypothetical protein
VNGAEAVPIVLSILGGIIMGCWTLATRISAMGEESRKKTLADEIEDHNRTRAELADCRRRLALADSFIREHDEPHQG